MDGKKGSDSNIKNEFDVTRIVYSATQLEDADNELKNWWEWIGESQYSQPASHGIGFYGLCAVCVCVQQRKGRGRS